jgi:hypothetical protein
MWHFLSFIRKSQSKLIHKIDSRGQLSQVECGKNHFKI